MRTTLTLLLAASLGACVTPVSMPQTPAVSTAAAEQCLTECQTGYAQCELPCGVGSTARRVPACQEQCYNELAACYEKCETL